MMDTRAVLGRHDGYVRIQELQLRWTGAKESKTGYMDTRAIWLDPYAQNAQARPSTTLAHLLLGAGARPGLG